jgi:hypothetical protein
MAKHFPNLTILSQNLFKYNLNTSRLYEKHYLDLFGLYRKRLLGALQGAPAPNKNLKQSFCSRKNSALFMQPTLK